MEKWDLPAVTTWPTSISIITHPYGYWKDTGVKITGNAVRNLTMMFLEMWNAIRSKDKDDEDYEPFFPELEYTQKEEGALIQPMEIRHWIRSMWARTCTSMRFLPQNAMYGLLRHIW